MFTERGLEATLDDVAHHAGVGVATVYRRFPDKASLADALFEQRIDLLVGLAETAYGEPDAWQALVSFMERATEMMAGDRGLRQMLMFAAYGHDRISYARDRMRPAVGRLVERAQAAGQVREDLAATDIPVIEFMLSVTTEYVRDVRPSLWRRFLVLWLDALQPARDSYTPLPVPGLTPDEFVTVMRTSPLGRHLGTVSSTPSRSSRPPTPPEILNNLLRLLMADLNELLAQIASLPLDDRWSKFPAEVFTQSLIGEAPVCLQTPHKPVRIIDRTITADRPHRRLSYPASEPFFL